MVVPDQWLLDQLLPSSHGLSYVAIPAAPAPPYLAYCLFTAATKPAAAVQDPTLRVTSQSFGPIPLFKALLPLNQVPGLAPGSCLRIPIAPATAQASSLKPCAAMPHPSPATLQKSGRGAAW